ncbi:MAG: integrin alpha [Nannocystaceae bacterium]
MGEEGGGDPGVANDEAGKAYLVSGLEVQLTADLGSLDLELDAAYSFIGDVGDALGSPSFSAVGDIDGDDKSDFVVESVSTGQSCIFLSTTVETLSPGQGAASTFAFSEADLCVSAFDSTTSSTDALALARGDVDGDGLDDWIFGASGMGSGGVTGEVYLVDSATISPATMSPLFVNLGGTSDAIFRGDPGSGSDLGSFTFLGARVASLGDLNNDGKDDFIATGPVKRLRDNSTPETNGKVYIVLSQ